MTHRERFLRNMRYQDFDRAPFWDFGAWPETIERWEREKPNCKEVPLTRDPCAGYGGWFEPTPPFEYKVVEEDDRTITYINHEGILLKERKDNPWSSMPQFIKFPVETREEFRTFCKERLNFDMASRLGADWVEKMEAHKDRDVPLFVSGGRWGGFFGPQRNLLGVENLCMMFYDDPAFVEEMMDYFADFMIAIMDKVLDHTDIDVFGFWEDMAYKTAPLISPEMVRKYMLPRYRRVVDHLSRRGVEFFALDSDGDISSLVPVWLDSGINILYPFEVQCGMDVNQVRKEYGKELRMWYGVDKRVAAWGPDAIDPEMKRVAPLVRDGGFIPGPDHSFPPDVFYENYVYFLKKLFEIL